MNKNTNLLIFISLIYVYYWRGSIKIRVDKRLSMRDLRSELELKRCYEKILNIKDRLEGLSTFFWKAKTKVQRGIKWTKAFLVKFLGINCHSSYNLCSWANVHARQNLICILLIKKIVSIHLVNPSLKLVNHF